MKKQKLTKFKRLIIRIVSVISIISILLSCFCISVLADDNLNIPYDGYTSNLLRLYKNWSMNDDGSGSYGDIVYTSDYRLNINSDYTSDYLKKPYFIVSPNTPDYPGGTTLNGNLSLFSYRLYSPLNLKEGIYTISFRFGIGQVATSGWLSSGGTLDVVSLSLVDNPNNLWFTKWYDVNYSVSYEGYCNVTLKLPITQSANITHFRFGLVFRNLKFGGSVALYNSRMEFVIFDSISLDYQPLYIMPDFTEQNDIDQAERDWINNNGDMLDYLDQYFSGFENLSSNFDNLIPRLSKFTLLFNSVLVRNGSMFNDILAFAVVIGVSALLINVVGSVGSFISRTTTNSFKGGRKK